MKEVLFSLYEKYQLNSLENSLEILYFIEQNENKRYPDLILHKVNEVSLESIYELHLNKGLTFINIFAEEWKWDNDYYFLFRALITIEKNKEKNNFTYLMYELLCNFEKEKYYHILYKFILYFEEQKIINESQQLFDNNLIIDDLELIEFEKSLCGIDYLNQWEEYENILKEKVFCKLIKNSTIKPSEEQEICIVFLTSLFYIEENIEQEKNEIESENSLEKENLFQLKTHEKINNTIRSIIKSIIETEEIWEELIFYIKESKGFIEKTNEIKEERDEYYEIQNILENVIGSEEMFWLNFYFYNENYENNLDQENKEFEIKWLENLLSNLKTKISKLFNAEKNLINQILPDGESVEKMLDKMNVELQKNEEDENLADEKNWQKRENSYISRESIEEKDYEKELVDLINQTEYDDYENQKLTINYGCVDEVEKNKFLMDIEQKVPIVLSVLNSYVNFEQIEAEENFEEINQLKQELSESRDEENNDEKIHENTDVEVILNSYWQSLETKIENEIITKNDEKKKTDELYEIEEKESIENYSINAEWIFKFDSDVDNKYNKPNIKNLINEEIQNLNAKNNIKNNQIQKSKLLDSKDK